jgi:hypothetical protein
MGSASTPPQPSADIKSVRKMLALFAVLAIAGVVLLIKSVVLGLAVLVVAEVFFAMAYRDFSRRSKPKS